MVRWTRLALALAWMTYLGLPGRVAAADPAGEVIVIRGTEVSSAPADIGRRLRAERAQVQVIRPEPAPVVAAPPEREREPQVVVIYGYDAGYDGDDYDWAGVPWEPWPWTTRWGAFRHRHHHGDKFHRFPHPHPHHHGFTHAGHGRFPNGFGAAPMHGAPMRAAGFRH